jgi:hypothetical protein
MTIGAVIFAQNNSKVDYVKLAVYAAERVKTYLNIPVTLITDSVNWVTSAYPTHAFDTIIDISSDQSEQYRILNDGAMASTKIIWKNSSRVNVYELSPYETTLVIDSDYIINSSILAMALERDYDFQIYKKSMDISEWRTSTEFERVNSYSIPFYWATVFVFKKSPVMESFFDLLTYIRNNWEYYRVLYSIESSLYRNDFAFSIAIHIMNGKMFSDFAVALPGSMVFSTDTDILVSISGNKVQMLTQKPEYHGEYLLVKTSGMDVHIMNKMSLARFIDGGIGV